MYNKTKLITPVVSVYIIYKHCSFAKYMYVHLYNHVIIIVWLNVLNLEYCYISLKGTLAEC